VNFLDKPVVSPTEQADLDRLRELMRQWCGVHLDDSKNYLMRNRLSELLVELKIDGLSQLIALTRGAGNSAVRDRIVDVLTTHETLFFRDSTPFDAITGQILPAIRKAAGTGRPRLRIWSAACSTGQEPYSLAMALVETLPDLAGWDVSIDATDVSAGSIKQAIAGEYLDHEISRGLSLHRRMRHFTPNNARWRINENLRKMVRFRVDNLLAPNPGCQQYDLILCRNVAIYFTVEDRNRIFENMSGRLTGEGYLFVGCSEVLSNLSHVLTSQRVNGATCYRPVRSASGATMPISLSSSVTPRGSVSLGSGLSGGASLSGNS